LFLHADDEFDAIFTPFSPIGVAASSPLPLDVDFLMPPAPRLFSHYFSR
jgi:hypothetical protein